jgi:signal transduction histidine kinase/HAMP domain-containing protein
MPMEQEQELPAWRQQLRRFSTLNIRGKIVLPYLILTLTVAVIGLYVVTKLVAGSLEERLNNQLLEAGRVVSDSLARQEIEHLESARAVAFTEGLAGALQAGDRERVAALAQPTAAVRNVECLIVTNAQGRAVFHGLREEDGRFEIVKDPFDPSELWMVQALLEAGDPNGLPKRSLALYLLDDRYYYFTAIPVGLEDGSIGVVIVGTSLDTLLPHFKKTSLADVTIYHDSGRAVASTFTGVEQPSDVAALLDKLAITPEHYERVIHSPDSTTVEQLDEIRGRDYHFAHEVLRVGNDSLGVFAVALPSSFIIRAGTTSRYTYAAIFAVAMVGVIAIGYLISQRITHPLNRLVHTSQAVAEGDLEQRTGIASTDEIGMLAATFDEMTGRLAERTRALEEALGRMRAILSSIGDGVLLEDMEKNLIPLNAAAEIMLQDMSAEFLLNPLRELSTVNREEIADPQMNPWLLERRRFEVGKKVISAHSDAVRTDEGKLLGTVIVLRDVTAEVEADRLKDAFVTHVSHELRTPLTAIMGYSDLLLATAGDALGKEQRGFLETIHRHTDNLVSMINALLDFSEVEAWDRVSLQRRPTSLSNLIEEVAKTWRPEMEEKGLTFQVETSPNLPQVDADARRLRWVVINLVRNAQQYTPEGGSVTLRLYERDDQVILDVIDTGIGISPKDQQQLFSRFYRVTNVTQDGTRGIGLGLYVAKAVIEAHGGEIRVFSEEGAGSTFSMVLPALQD